jgi:uncharacterized SAM-binding protein YcdF (DUF218 family)
MRRSRYFVRPRRLVKLLTVALLVGTIWLFGLFQFVNMMPVGVVDKATHTDAIVVLTGGSLRLGKGLDLLMQGLSGSLFISGVYQGIDVRELLKILKREPQQLENLISIGIANNTRGNAVETSTWVTARKIQSLRLVTADYHMLRSLFEFRLAMPNVIIIAHPVFPDNVKRERWWAWPGTASLLISEYNKIIFAWVRSEIGSLAILSEIKKEGGSIAVAGGAR